MQQPDSLGIRVGKVGFGIPQLNAPVTAGPPCRAVENKAGVLRPGDFAIAFVIPPKRVITPLRFQQVERGKTGQVEPFVKNKCGFQAAICQHVRLAHLRQKSPVFRCHVFLQSVCLIVYRGR